MKKFNSWIVVTLAVAMSTLMSVAQAAPAPKTADLGAVMKDMSKQVLQIIQNSTDASKNAASAALCDALLSDIATARGVMPDKVQQLPQDQQSGQMAQYQQMIDQLSSAVTQMKTDFLGNNNSAVAQDLGQIQTLKSNGHQAFKN